MGRKPLNKIFLSLFFLLATSISHSEEGKEAWAYKFQEGKTISYTLIMEITTSTRKNFQEPRISSKHLIAQITEKVEKQISTESYQIFYCYELLKDNGEAPFNYHPQCNRLQVSESGLLVKSQEAGYSWKEFRIGSSFLSLIDPQSPNFGCSFPMTFFDCSKTYSEKGRSYTFPADSIVFISPIMNNNCLVKLNYEISSAASASKLFTSGNGSVHFSKEKGLLLRNEGKIQRVFEIQASDSFQTTVTSSFTLELNEF